MIRDGCRQVIKTSEYFVIREVVCQIAGKQLALDNQVAFGD